MGHAGREKEAIIISMVRSNDSGTVGFLSDSRFVETPVTVFSMCGGPSATACLQTHLTCRLALMVQTDECGGDPCASALRDLL